MDINPLCVCVDVFAHTHWTRFQINTRTGVCHPVSQPTMEIKKCVLPPLSFSCSLHELQVFPTARWSSSYSFRVLLRSEVSYSLWMWLPAPWLRLQMDQRRKNKGMDMIPRYKSLLFWLCPPTPLQLKSACVSYLVCLCADLVGLRLHLVLKCISANLCKTLLNWISLPISKASTDCCAHLLSFWIYASTATNKWLSSTMRDSSHTFVLRINLKHRWKYSGTGLKWCLPATLGK